MKFTRVQPGHRLRASEVNAVYEAIEKLAVAFDSQSPTVPQRLALLKRIANATAPGVYSVAVVQGFSNFNPGSASPDKTAGQVVGSSGEAWFCNLQEWSASANWRWTTSDYALGVLAGLATDGKPVFIGPFPADPYLSGTNSVGSATAQEAALSDSVSDCDQKTSTTVTIMVRWAYAGGGDKVIYGYFRTFTYVGGKLRSVSAETRVTLHTPWACA